MDLKRKNKKIYFYSLSLIIIGSSLIIGKCLYRYNFNIKNNKQIEEYFTSPIIINESNNKLTNEIKKQVKTNNNQNNEKYISVLEIPKISLKVGIYDKKSKLNNVNKNIYLLNESNMPNEENGNFILAAHSGNSNISYFKNLPKLVINDIAYVYYEGIKYKYKLVNNYEVDKIGKIAIVRNLEKNTMTLITCKRNTDKQLVFIFEIMKDGD